MMFNSEIESIQERMRIDKERNYEDWSQKSDFGNEENKWV